MSPHARIPPGVTHFQHMIIRACFSPRANKGSVLLDILQFTSIIHEPFRVQKVVESGAPVKN
jgi:hypothetical protein